MGFLFPFFFVGGFLLYGSLFAAVGAAMGEDGDQQSLMVPITVPIIISIFIAINVINNPDSSLGFWGSIIPLTSPVVMSTMLPFKPALWQIGLSMVTLAAGFILTTWIAARIYRVGILMYGKKISLKQMGKWVFSRA
jgi:ABC-2 type transport system permease protein